ncbi:MAG TPA: family 43 glycosylhydrolase [Bryobacteraceae bacterium]|nr:family 43 glycosylhydrolase [Bryobacteraceae bacterium]
MLLFLRAIASILLSPTLFGAYRNPLTLTDPKTGPAMSCPDPAIIRQHSASADTWFLFCTGDPLNFNDTDASGNLRTHLINEFTSTNLVDWTYIGDALPSRPAWVAVNNSLWAPAVEYFNNRYYLYYVAPATTLPGGGSAIGVATASSPAGPWTDSGAPVVAPEAAFCCPGSSRNVIDPDVVNDDSGQRYISFGGFFGGISIRKLSADGLTSDPSSETLIAIDNRYEGASFYKHDGWYYLFVSATNCCNGPLTGYTVFTGRARTPLGPFLDRQGVALSSFATEGTIVISMNGNRWVGPGGNVVFDDDSGQSWMLYHAVDSTAPFFPGHPGFTRRPALLDRLDWIDGWPTVRGGYWASDDAEPAPAAQPSQHDSVTLRERQDDTPGDLIASLSDEFNSGTLSAQWRFIHPNANNAYALSGGALQLQTRGADEISDPQHVAILAEQAPAGDYLVETKVTTSVPFDNSCCYNFAQPALFIYGDDQNSLKLDVFPNFDTRQTEFGKQIGPVPAGYPGYGNTVVGPPGAAATWLRIAKHTAAGGPDLYTAYQQRRRRLGPRRNVDACARRSPAHRNRGAECRGIHHVIRLRAGLPAAA